VSIVRSVQMPVRQAMGAVRGFLRNRRQDIDDLVTIGSHFAAVATTREVLIILFGPASNLAA
jgi:hypothetical protein